MRAYVFVYRYTHIFFTMGDIMNEKSQSKEFIVHVVHSTNMRASVYQ